MILNVHLVGLYDFMYKMLPMSSYSNILVAGGVTNFSTYSRLRFKLEALTSLAVFDAGSTLVHHEIVHSSTKGPGEHAFQGCHKVSTRQLF